ncbi:MAG: hypothetical protein SGILL_003497, partial [Bacillariaceae sp.]
VSNFASRGIRLEVSEFKQIYSKVRVDRQVDIMVETPSSTSTSGPTPTTPPPSFASIPRTPPPSYAPPTHVATPKIGGVIGSGYQKHAWTGGKPNVDWTALDETASAQPRTPKCERHSDYKSEQKAYAFRSSSKESRLEQYEIGKATPTTLTYVQSIVAHMRATGMDSILYVKHPVNDEMISVLTAYQSLTIPYVTEQTNALRNNKWDAYDKLNNTGAAEYLWDTIGPTMISTVEARDPDRTATAATVWMLIMSKGVMISESAIEKMQKEFKKISPMQFPGQDVFACCTKIRATKRTMDAVNAYQGKYISNVVKNMTACTVEPFRFKVYGLDDTIERVIATQRGQSNEAISSALSTAGVDFETVITRLETIYHDMDEQWTPKHNKNDPNGAPEMNFHSMSADEINKYISDKVQVDTEAGLVQAEQTAKHCFGCGSTEHFKRDNKCKPADIAAFQRGTPPTRNQQPKLPPAPTANGPTVIEYNGVQRYWCAKCSNGKGRWTLGHVTAEHTGPSRNRQQTQEAQPETEANAAEFAWQPIRF